MRGEPLGPKMITTTSFAEKSDQASRFFRANRSLRAASPQPSGTGDSFLFLSTGAEARAYSRSASPRRGLIRYPPRVPCTIVSVLEALYTYGCLHPVYDHHLLVIFASFCADPIPAMVTPPRRPRSRCAACALPVRSEMSQNHF